MNEKGNFDHKKKGKSFLFLIKKNSFVRIFFYSYKEKSLEKGR